MPSALGVSAAPLASPGDVLSFWFGAPPGNEAEVLACIQRWFRGGQPMDKEIERRFAPTIQAALRRELDGWAETARRRLALVLLLDQMTRSLYRNDPRSYAGDSLAQSLSVEAFNRAIDREFEFPERVFLAMPMAHAEDLALQQRVAKLAADFAAEAPPVYRIFGAIALEQATKYLGVIQRFGRFPHRNAILGRTSTSDELEFLKTWAEVQPPKVARRSGS